MLKALELNGFKSFADKTRFEFPPGITVVVGPNGSGKSNIVDAMKWVLGEQSAKSLRGKEMADVIFKGSGGASSARRPANAAEVTIVFDNSRSLFPVETEEVRVTRRVYRSGESEYLINGNPCRLRDVKDIFRGTGMGADAYSLIEQGKVDQLLQASPRDRRAIFEEAAGISRFKAKKVETQRRLERVEQNLERLKDIVDEVESQLRSVRNQASKARRFKEYNDRLKELRTHVGLADWRRFTSELEALEQRLSGTGAELESLAASTNADEQRLAHADQESGAARAALHTAEAAANSVLQELAGHQSTVSHAYRRLDELGLEITRHREQARTMVARAQELHAQLRELDVVCQAAEAEELSIRARLETHQNKLAAGEQDLAHRRQQREELREELAHQQRLANDIQRRLTMLESEQLATEQQRDRARLQLESYQQQQEDLQREHATHLAAEQALQQQEQAAREALHQARRAQHSTERELNEQQQKAVDLQRQLAVASERARLLQDLERRHEGLSPGVKELLARAESAGIGPLATMRGMIADLIRVDVRMAPMIDAALGELTQYVVVHGPGLLDQIATGELTLQGRVGLLDLTALQPTFARHPAWSQEPGVLGRADEFVESDGPFEPLIRHLLASTWCVETLQDALRLARGPARDGSARFVTRSGEILESDGKLQAGPRQAALGLVSRRSELRSLHAEILQLDPLMRAAERNIAQLRELLTGSAHQVDSLTQSYDDAASQLMNARLATRTIGERLSGIGEQVATYERELSESAARLAANADQIHQFQDKLANVTRLIDESETQLAAQKLAIADQERARQVQLDQVMEVKVECAKSEQRLDSLRAQRQRAAEDQLERERALGDTRQQLQLAVDRRVQTERTILVANGAQAELYLQVESHQMEIARLRAVDATRQAEREQLVRALDQSRRQSSSLGQTHHQLELEANRLQLERQTLRQRVRDDYEIDLAEYARRAPADDSEPHGREDVEREIHELRRRLSNMGAVNMAALEEIESLEGRHLSLAGQYQDLVDAKESLARIIHKINADSRRLFTETLEAIRTNFQALFRRVFGGGHADIVLEEGFDILEAGIDIVATPPGKHSLGISLLSGGERALTAVTLLLAIFQYRPSPFCVLDEVDGPLDEANIGRFVDVLTEFLQWTKFVVVTHSKKTMTAAHTLYGVTMQESGVSKRVSVQFEDVSEDGQIRSEALQRQVREDRQHPAGDDDEQAA